MRGYTAGTQTNSANEYFYVTLQNGFPSDGRLDGSMPPRLIFRGCWGARFAARRFANSGGLVFVDEPAE